MFDQDQSGCHVENKLGVEGVGGNKAEAGRSVRKLLQYYRLVVVSKEAKEVVRSGRVLDI